MTAASTSQDRNPVEALAEEFLRRQRRGERPTLEDYCRRHPELADEIRDLFPVLIRMEDLGADGRGGRHRRRGRSAPRPGWSGWATSASSARSAGAGWASSTRPSRSRSAAAWP